MDLFQTLRLAARALLRNALRSFLTALGIIIGVAAVIAMVAIGEGAKSQVEQAFAAMGTNLLVVLSGSTTAGGARGGFGSHMTLTWGDLKAIQTEVPSVAAAVPLLRLSAQVQSDEQNWSTLVHGTTPAYFQIRRWSTSRGVLLADSDQDSGAKHVLLGQTVAEKLFGASADPVGQLVRIRGVPFEVVGVLERKGQSPMGQDYDDVVFVPLSTYRSRLSPTMGSYIPGSIHVSVAQGQDTLRAQRLIEGLLRERHRLPPGADDDFSIRNLAEVAAGQQQSAETLSTLLAAIAAVSLIVGGIGIMNIMLVSVTERTREIGVRMAVGAGPAQILAQFLTEALLLSLVGGALGIGLGLGVAEWLAKANGWPLLIAEGVVVAAAGFSGLVGVVFGLYPAVKASRLDPIVALRFE